MQETQAGEGAAALPSLGFSSFPAVPLAFFRQFHHIMSIMWLCGAMRDFGEERGIRFFQVGKRIIILVRRGILT